MIEPPVPWAEHLAGRELRAVEVALQVDVDDLVPGVLGDILGRFDDVDAGVVDHHVELAEPSDGGLDQLLATGPVSGIDLHRQTRAASGTDLRRGGLGFGQGA